MSALITTLGAFTLILLLVRVKVPLAGAIVIGSGVIALAFGLGPHEVLFAAGEGLILPRSVGLIVVTFCLLCLSSIMQAAGQMEQIVSLGHSLLRRPVVTMVALPGLIGLLPMPGGALFSAPMVESAAAGESVPRGKLSAINYWFRHIWEYWWPLYPGVILAVTLTGQTFAAFAMFHSPLTLFMFASGLLILRKIPPNLHVAAPPAPVGTMMKLLAVTSPIWLVLIVWGLVKVALVLALGPAPRGPGGESTVLTAMHSYLPITVGLVVSAVWATRLGQLGMGTLKKVIVDRQAYRMALLVGSIMVFQYMLARVEAPRRIAEELAELNVPILVVLAGLPLIAGLVTGLAVGFVGTSFPIVLGLISEMPQAGHIAPYVALAYLFGHMGQMLSPLHLCHVLSNNYFKTNFAAVYRQILPSVCVCLLVAVGYFFCLRLILN